MTKKNAKKPWFKFYPSDWQSDEMLRVCSIAARGLWVEMMCLMHKSEPYGSLLVNGARIDKKKLSVLVGIPERECTVLLMELEANGVFSREADGTVYSRRMRRDAEQAKIDQENGKGGGNPDLIGKDKGGVNPPDKAQSPETRIDDGGSAGARGQSLFTEGSKALAAAFLEALGIEPKATPPELAGVDWRAVSWESAGWTADLIGAETRRVGAGKPISYYEKCFATAFAKRQSPLPKVEVSTPSTVVTHVKPARESAITSTIDRRLAEARERERGLGGDEGSPRLLSHG